PSIAAALEKHDDVSATTQVTAQAPAVAPPMTASAPPPVATPLGVAKPTSTTPSADADVRRTARSSGDRWIDRSRIHSPRAPESTRPPEMANDAVPAATLNASPTAVNAVRASMAPTGKQDDAQASADPKAAATPDARSIAPAAAARAETE